MVVKADQERAAIGLGARHVRGGDLAGRTGAVFHDHRAPAQLLRQTRLQNARQDIGAAARRVRHHQHQRPFLGGGGRGDKGAPRGCQRA
ncbi:hypothetical protein D3C81_2041490 [compost metagenome]